MTPADIRKALPRLTRAQLLELKKHIDVLIQLGANETDKADDRDWLTEGIWGELARRGLVSRAFVPQVVKAARPKAYEASCAMVRMLLLERAGRPLDYQEQIALGQVCGRALGKYLEWADRFGLKMMLSNVQNVPEAIEASFPGYLESNLLYFLITERMLGR